MKNNKFRAFSISKNFIIKNYDEKEPGK